jgi:hypothetical protein
MVCFRITGGGVYDVSFPEITDAEKDNKVNRKF